MTRNLHLVLHLDDRQVCLDHALLPDGTPLTARGLVRGIRACADRIEERIETKETFDDIIELGETA